MGRGLVMIDTSGHSLIHHHLSRSIEFRAVTMQLLKESKRPIDSPSSLLVACEVQGLLWQELGVNHNEVN